VLESDIIPYHLSSPPGERIVVLAPHPDDETLGCGGTIRLLRKSGKKVKVLFLTSGDQADPSNKLSKILHSENPPNPPLLKGGEGGFSDRSHLTEYAILREREAIKAMKILGVSDYEFLRFPDRKLDIYFESALGRLLEIMKQYAADIIYSPSMIELNPDHRTTAALAMDIQKIVMKTDAPSPLPPPRGGRARAGVVPVKILFYEVATPLRPNVLIDITSTHKSKRKAVKTYESQLRITPYLTYIAALNEVRTLTVSGAKVVEAFWMAEFPLRAEDITGWLSYQTPVS
jgi:LmbE family N-acetylglucosaminyl deacetylase